MTESSKHKLEELKKVLEGKRQEKGEGLAPASEIQAFEEKLQRAKALADENYDKYLRLLAEFDNYKKRTGRDLEDRIKYSHEIMLKELIKVLDDFDRVMEHLPTDDSPVVKTLVDGIQLVHRDLSKGMKKFGLKEITTEGQYFDPHLHEAIAQVETNDHAEGTIVECHRKGYQFHDRLLRAASVTVAKAKANE